MSNIENSLLTVLLGQIKQDRLVLPTLPEIAMRVREAVDDPNASLHSIAEVMSKDAAMSARLIRMANSAYYAPRTKIQTLTAAVTRIGLDSIKNIATSMAMEQLFICQNDIVFEYFDRTWGNSVDVSCGAMAAFTRYTAKRGKQGLEADTLTLMGLVHNIGVLPILKEAEKQEQALANPGFLQQAINKLAKHIGVAIIRAWEFDKEYAIVVAKWDDLSFQLKGVTYLDFIRIGAINAGLIPGIRSELLKPLVEKGILSSDEDLDDPEFIAAYEELQASYN